MAEKISVEIGLEGGDQVERELEGVLETGKKTFSELQASADQLDFSSVSDQFQTVGTAIKGVQNAVKSAAGFEQIIQGVKNVEGAFEALGVAATKMATRMTKSLGILGVAARSFGPIGIAVGVVGGAFVKMGNDATASMQSISAEAVKLGQTLEQTKKQIEALQQRGVSKDAAVEGIKKLGEAVADAKLDRAKKAFEELREAVSRGWGAQGTAQLKILNETAMGAGKAAEFAREKLKELELPIPIGAAKTLKELIAETGSAEKGMAAFLAQLQKMPPGLDRTTLAIGSLGEKAGTEIVQGMRLAEGSMTATEAAAERYRQQVNALSADWAKFKDETGTPVMSVVVTALSEAIKVAEAFAWTFRMLGSVINTVATGGAAAIQFVVDAVTGLGTGIATLASSIAGITWGAISDAGVAAWNAIVTAVQGAGTAITTFVSNLGTITWDIISSVGVAAWNALTGAIQGAIDKLLVWLGLKQQAAPATGGGGGAPGAASGGLLGGRGSGTSDSNLAWVSRGEHVMPASVVRQPGVLSFLEALRRGGGIPGFAGGGRVGGGDQLWNFLDGITNQLDAALRALNPDLVNSVLRIAKAVEMPMQALLGLMGQIKGNAGGGLLGGRGTGTSDSNLAWVSRGEFITPARAVAQPGVLAFLEALRRSGGNLSRVLDGMGRFALGGMITRPMMPAYAAGGLAGGNLGTLTLGLPSGGSVTVRASAGVADELRREAAMAQVRSGGRKPSRYS